MDVQELPVVGEGTEIHRNVEDAPDTQNCVCEAERVRRRERVIRWTFATEDLNFFRIGPKDAIERISSTSNTTVLADSFLHFISNLLLLILHPTAEFTIPRLCISVTFHKNLE